MSAIVLLSCSKENEEKAVNAEKTDRMETAQRKGGNVFTPIAFKKSVAIIKSDHSISIPAKTNNEKVALTLEIINFDHSYSLNEAYIIESIEYTDNGKYNDLKEGDNIYTSVQTFNLSEDTKNSSGNLIQLNIVADQNDFLFLEELKDNIQSKVAPGGSVYAEIGCDIVTRPCPQTTWYNTCWFSDECTCIYLENCELSIGVEFGT